MPPPQVPDSAGCFHSTGLFGPTPIFNPAQCALLARRHRIEKLKNAAEQPKGLAVADGYPAWQFHTIRNASDAPVSYLMFKWRSAAFAATAPLGAKVHTAALSPPPGDRPGRSRRVVCLMGQPTNFLGRLHAHLTEMDPGQGYDAHRDRYDVAIIVISGQLDTGGEVIGPGTVLYYAAGVLHGLRNVGEEIVRYLVIEFEHTAARKRKREAKAAAQQIAGSTA